MNKITDCEEEPIEIKYESVDFGEFVIPDSSQQFVQDIKVEEIALQELTTEINGENVSNEGANSSEKNGGKIIKIKEETIPDSEFVTISDKDLIIDEVKFEEIVEESVENELLNCQNLQVENANEEIRNSNEQNAEERATNKCETSSSRIFYTVTSGLNKHNCKRSDDSNKTSPHDGPLKIHPPSHKVEIYKCPWKCKETFETNNSFLQHLTIHIHVCQTCGEKFPRPSELKSHILNAHGQIINNVDGEIGNCNEKEFRVIIIKCKICSKIFKTLSGLNSHKCNVCDVSNNETVTSRSKLKIHHPSHDVQAEIYTCPECKETFETNNSFLQHLKIHKKPLHVCQTCGKKFEFPSLLKRHILNAHIKNGQMIKNVDGEMPTPHREKANGDDVDGEIGICNKNAKESRVIIKCKICRRIFNTLSDLNSHDCNINDVSNNETVTSRSQLKIQHSSHEVQAEIYKCPECKESFETNNSFLQHLKIHNKPLHVCQTCGEKFEIPSKLKLHTLFHILSENPHECEFCQERFTHKSDLIKHTLIHKGIKLFKCNECGEEFRRTGELMEHSRTKHSGERPFECRMCHKRFASSSVLTRHERIHSGERPFQCGKSFSKSGDLAEHSLIHESDKPFSCNERFKHCSSLFQHMRNVSGSKPHECKECGKKFSQSSSLNLHIRTHSGIKPFECQICYKRFTQRGSLNTHLKIHSGEKLYKCEECKKKFTESGSLKRHIRMVHLGLKVKPFSCQFCKKCFSSNSSLKSHVLIHNGLKPFKCETCDKSFAQSGNLVVHIRTHTGLKPYECEFCQKSFNYIRNLRSHLRSKHFVV